MVLKRAKKKTKETLIAPSSQNLGAGRLRRADLESQASDDEGGDYRDDRMHTLFPVSVMISSVASAVAVIASGDEEALPILLEAVGTRALRDSAGRTEVVESGIIKHIVPLCRNGNIEIKRSAFYCLNALSHGDKTHRLQLRKAGAIKECVSGITSSDPDIKELCLLSLVQFADDLSGAADIESNKGLVTLVSLLAHEDHVTSRLALQIIHLVTKEYQSRITLREGSGLQECLRIATTSEDDEIQILAVEACTRLTEDVQSKQKLIADNAVESCFEILNSEEAAAVHVSASMFLAALTTDGEAISRLNPTSLSTIASLLTTSDPGLVEGGLTTLARAAKSPKVLRRLADLPETANVIELASDSNEGVVSAALDLATSCVKDDQVMTTLTTGGLFAAVEKALKSEHANVREAAAGTACGLAAYDENWPTLRSTNFLTNLLNCAAKGPTNASLYALDAVNNCMQHPDARDVFEDANGVEIVTDIIGLKSGRPESAVSTRSRASEEVAATNMESLMVTAMTTLSVSCRSPTVRAQISAEAIASLIEKIKSDDSKRIRSAAAWVLSAAASDERLSLEVLNCDGLKVLWEARDQVKFATDALEKVLLCNASAKYALRGHLGIDDSISDGFFDPGRVNEFVSLANLTLTPPTSRRETILVDTTSDIELADLVLATSTTIDELNAVLQEKEEHLKCLPQAEIISKTVIDRMGGVGSKKVEFAFQFEISRLKRQLNSNGVPLGLIKTGGFYHRALLFKFLCDQTDLDCELFRGEYGRAWVHVPDEEGKVWLIDLMFSMGTPLKPDSKEAQSYCSIART